MPMKAVLNRKRLLCTIQKTSFSDDVDNNDQVSTINAKFIKNYSDCSSNLVSTYGDLPGVFLKM